MMEEQLEQLKYYLQQALNILEQLDNKEELEQFAFLSGDYTNY